MIRIYGAQNGAKQPTSVALAAVPEFLEGPSAVLWIDLDQPTPEDVQEVAKVFKLHPLEVEDCIADVELPKLDEFEDHVYLITHGLKLDEASGELGKIELDSFLGRNWLITSHHVHSRSVQIMREKVERSAENLTRGADFLLHAILDSQVDNYLPIIDWFDGEVDRIEEEVFERPREALLGEILRLRHAVVNMRRSIVPQRDVIGRLARHDIPFVTPKCSIYFRDVFDHVVRVHEMLEAIRDVVAGLTESYRSMISQRLNEVMKTLTLISTIFLPMTFVASIYGMNFERAKSGWNMPELGWAFGYPFALGIMFFVGITFLLYFRSKKWV